MVASRSGYLSFGDGGSHNEDIPLDEIDETPLDSGVILNIVPDATKSRWNHIEDLDTFFKRIYIYHQSHGYKMLLLKEILELFQFKFIVGFTIVLSHCVDYNHLFDDTKKDIVDVFRPLEKLNIFVAVLLPFAIIIWFIGLVRLLYHMVKFYDIKKFYNIALKIDDDDLNNYTWNEVQKKILDVQTERNMCVHKKELTELDIYHRVLRIENYLVAMFNKNLIQEKIYIPLIGEIPCLTKAILLNIEILLFRGPFAPFENNWYLREDYKNPRYRHILSRKLAKHITIIAIGNLILFPIIFTFLIVHTFLNYGILFKRDPSVFTANCWSQYGRWYLRHFNELNHEVFARLKRAFKPATKYKASFKSPLTGLIAQNVLFFCGAVLGVLIVLAAYDEDVLQVDSLLSVVSALSMAVYLANKSIPNENLAFCPEQLLTTVLAHVHYLPTSWRGKAHTSHVRQQFSLVFQSRLSYVLIELASPILTPYILLRHFRPRSLDVIDFIRNFTISVVGVGDVCSFAQMDIRKHGNPDWQLTHITEPKPQSYNPERRISAFDTNQYTQGENGKTELSLFHFTITNPEWKMPEDAKNFVEEIKENAIADIKNNKDPMKSVITQSLRTLGNIDSQFSAMSNSIFLANTGSLKVHVNDDQKSENIESYSGQGTNSCNLGTSLYYDAMQSIASSLSLSTVRRRNVSKQEGKCEGPSDSIVKSLHGPNLPEPEDSSTADMCLSTLFIYDVNQKQVDSKKYLSI